jgi:hypothetical protein
MSEQLDPSDPAAQAWCLTLWASLAEGGVWAVPRSAMIFRKQGNFLALFAVMPWQEGLPITAEQLIEQQRGEYASIATAFRLAGIEVMDDTGLM